MENETNPDSQLKNRSKKNRVWLIALILLIAFIAIGYFAAGFFKKDKDSTEESTATTTQNTSEIPAKVMANKFGFLGGGADDTGKLISESGAAWVRPHPGTFVWDMMQESANAAISYKDSDQQASAFQSTALGTLATIWPFADWDQKNLADAEQCKVSINDEFLPKNDKKGRGSYLPQYRCNPNDWLAYQKWVEAIVERYDGDGQNDMTGLKIPIKYWEVMNEPDLNYNSNIPDAEDGLNFYKQGPTEYAILLIKTSEAIRKADPDAKILIAGAAGGDTRMLNFYREAFKTTEARTAFDIGNVHCISNDRETHDFNVAAYKNMLSEFAITAPVWVTEAEAFYRENTTSEQNYQSTKKSADGAIAAGAERIFFTRYNFDDFRTDMSKKTPAGSYPSSAKYRELIESYQ